MVKKKSKQTKKQSKQVKCYWKKENLGTLIQSKYNPDAIGFIVFSNKLSEKEIVLISPKILEFDSAFGYLQYFNTYTVLGKACISIAL